MAPFDTDGDGRLSLAEFQIRSMGDFDAADRNQDQVLGGDELPAGAEPVTRAEFQARVAARFASADLDGDGYIDAGELIEMSQVSASASASD